MPRKKKEVLKTCGKIETQFPAHVTQTEIAISKLKDAELIDPKTVSYYATKLRECRERIGLTEYGGVSSRKVFADNYRAYNVCTQLR